MPENKRIATIIARARLKLNQRNTSQITDEELIDLLTPVQNEILLRSRILVSRLSVSLAKGASEAVLPVAVNIKNIYYDDLSGIKQPLTFCKESDYALFDTSQTGIPDSVYLEGQTLYFSCQAESDLTFSVHCIQLEAINPVTKVNPPELPEQADNALVYGLLKEYNPKDYYVLFEKELDNLTRSKTTKPLVMDSNW